MRKVIAIGILIVVSCLGGLTVSGCTFFGPDKPSSNEPDLSGGGIRTTNGEVLGRIKFADASPAVGRQIRLYKIFLSAAPDSMQAEWAGISDSLGNYQFSKVPAGKFVMTVTDAKTGEMAIMPRLTKGEEGYFVLDALLAPWVTLVGRVIPNENHKAEQISVCIPGIPQCTAVGPDSVYVIAHAPQGSYDLVFMQDIVANYLPVQVVKGKSDTLYVKDTKIDRNDPDTTLSGKGFSFYPSDAKHSLYVVPVPYTTSTIPQWYTGKKFEGIRYFTAVGDNQFEQQDVEDYLEWPKSRTLKMPLYTPTGTDTSELVDFPYLLRLNKSNFDFSQAKGHGEDFRISRGNGNHLPYFIERWDSAAGIAEIWTRIDYIAARNSNQYLTYYWGNAQVSDHSIPMAPLSRHVNERIAWLLDDNSASSLVADVGGAFPAYFTKVGISKGATSNNSVPGPIVNALSLNGINDAITIDPHPILDFPRFTISIWAKNDQAKIPLKQYLISKGGAGNRQWHLALVETNQIRFEEGGKGGGWSGSITTKSPIPHPENWHQFVVTFDAGVVHIYVDGVEFASDIYGTILADIPDFGSSINLGVSPNLNGTYWQGQIDNFFYDSKVRSADWIKLIYENEKP